MAGEAAVAEGPSRSVSQPNLTVSPSSTSYHRRSGRKSVIAEPAAKPPEFGSGSVFDAKVVSDTELPFQLPVAKYLDEALVGLCGAPHTFDVPDNPEKARATWKRMQSVVGMENTNGICESLAWVAIGVIFGTVAEVALEGLRTRLSRSWFLLTIELGRTEFVGNLVVGQRDAVLHTLPTLLVQVILRLIVDAFPSDQAEVLRNIEVMVDKLSVIVHKEVLGYPLNRDTAHGLRRQLFRNKVLEKPYINIKETVQSMKRLTVMQDAQAKVKPLMFGVQKRMPLEEQQLGHILEHRNEQLMEKENERAKRTSFTAERPASAKVRHPLLSCVDSYQRIADEGEDLFLQQFESLYAQGDGPSDNEASPSASRNVSKERPASSSAEAKSSVAAEARTTTDTRTRTQRFRSVLQRSFTLTCTATTATTTMRLMRERRELEAQERKHRDAKLSSRIGAELPEAYACRSIGKSMVSPIISRQLGADLESTPSPIVQKWFRKASGSKSSPSLLDSRMSDDSGLPDIAKGPAGAAALASAVAGAEAAVAAGTGNRASKTKRRIAGKVDGSRSFGGYGEARQESRTTSPKRDNPALIIDLNAQQSMKGSEILRRLEQQREAISKNSFEAYKREFDLETGVRKQKLDGGKIKREETQYVESLEALVGSRSEPALRLPVHRPSRPPKSKKSLSDIRGIFGADAADADGAASPSEATGVAY